MNEAQLGDIARLITTEDGDAVLAELEGEVDLSNAEEFVRRLKEAVPPGAWGIAVDLSKGEYIDSAGIRGLLEVQRHLSQRRQLLTVVVPSTSPLRSVLELTGLRDAIPLHDGRPPALAQLRGRYADPNS